MLEFDESFFKGEEIDGFYVEEEMKRAWAAQLEVLMEIDRICKKYGLQWYAEYGTLIGAVRHKGFIPWDDDMDISMKRADYNKFMEVAPKELPKGWYVLSPQLQASWSQPFMRVVTGHCVDIRPEYLERFHGCPYAVGIDIFPVDYIPKDKDELEVLEVLYEHTLYVRQLIDDKKIGKEREETEEKIEELLKGLEEFLCFKVDREKNITNQLLRRLEDMSTLYSEDECDELGILCFMRLGTSKQRKKEWYRETVMLPFENVELPAPIGYEEVLNSTYANYKVPNRVLGNHYPFYKNQKKEVEAMVERVKQINDRLSDLEAVMEQEGSEE